MIHPLLRLAASQPHLIRDHLEAYAELLCDEVKKTGAAWGVRIGLFAAAGVLGLVGLVLAGVAIMLWASLPPSGYQAPWVLVAVPAVAVVASVVCAVVAKKTTMENGFDAVRKQISADMAMLRDVSAAA